LVLWPELWIWLPRHKFTNESLHNIQISQEKAAAQENQTDVKIDNCELGYEI
jgi:intergrase/recombinase